jgi:hypothetical protein
MLVVGRFTATICGRSGRTDQGPRSKGRPTVLSFRVHARNLDWLKSKNPDAPAVKREAEEDWGRGSVATPLILKRAPIGDNQDDYAVLEKGVVVAARAAGSPLDGGERPQTCCTRV